MNIVSHGQTFSAHKCPVCGGRDSDPKLLAKHVRRHELMGADLAINEYHEARIVKLSEDTKPKKRYCSVYDELGKCKEEVYCGTRCRVHYARWYKDRHPQIKHRKTKMEQWAAEEIKPEVNYLPSKEAAVYAAQVELPL